MKKVTHIAIMLTTLITSGCATQSQKSYQADVNVAKYFGFNGAVVYSVKKMEVSGKSFGQQKVRSNSLILLIASEKTLQQAGKADMIPHTRINASFRCDGGYISMSCKVQNGQKESDAYCPKEENNFSEKVVQYGCS